MRKTSLLFVPLLLTGCFTHGQPAGSIATQDGVHGAVGTVLVRSGRQSSWYNGELLAVQDTALFMLVAGKVVRVPFRMIEEPFQSPAAHKTHEPAGLKPFARYTRGLTPDQLRRLLEAYGQTAPILPGTPARDRQEERRPEVKGAEVSAEFVAAARSAARAYVRLDDAIAAGYRRLGPSFPGMGEHWIHPGLVVEGRVDPLRPPILCYARVGGVPRLVALVYTVPLREHESPPNVPVAAALWHDHSERVDEESLLLVHTSSQHLANEPRLAMFHAWTELPNAEGLHAQNNWRLPFLVAGLDAASVNPMPDAARALSLWTSESDYYIQLFDAVAAPGQADRSALERILALQRTRAHEWIITASATSIEAAELTKLQAIWVTLWSDIQSSVTPATWDRLQHLREAH